MNKAIVILPTYNEAENIGLLIKEIFQIMPELGVLVVDDGSPDGTPEVVRALLPQYPLLELIERSSKLGLASAYLAAFKLILDKNNPEFIFTMDGDFSHNPRYLPAMMAAAEKADLVVGSRYTKGGGVKNWSLRRRLLSRLGNTYARLVTGVPLYDLTAGFCCMRTSFLRKLSLTTMQAEGYAWLIELKALFYKNGARLKEVPIIFEERRFGSSKISRHIIAEGIVYPWQLRGKLKSKE